MLAEMQWNAAKGLRKLSHDALFSLLMESSRLNPRHMIPSLKHSAPAPPSGPNAAARTWDSALGSCPLNVAVSPSCSRLQSHIVLHVVFQQVILEKKRGNHWRRGKTAALLLPLLPISDRIGRPNLWRLTNCIKHLSSPWCFGFSSCGWHSEVPPKLHEQRLLRPEAGEPRTVRNLVATLPFGKKKRKKQLLNHLLRSIFLPK